MTFPSPISVSLSVWDSSGGNPFIILKIATTIFSTHSFLQERINTKTGGCQVNVLTPKIAIEDERKGKRREKREK